MGAAASVVIRRCLVQDGLFIDQWTARARHELAKEYSSRILS
jgi:hypothetical protein